jgi:BirA family biotin operon repressor/biotin-[acetyl-CoA-carboxylase] ligase
MNDDLKLFSFTELDSTQDKAKELLKNNEFVCVTTEKQNSGRGRSGNTWVSNSGDIIFSTGISTDLPIEKISAISLLAGILIIEILDPDSRNLALKWPNDIIDKTTRKKIGGILVETYISQNLNLNLSSKSYSNLVIGVGINKNSSLHPNGIGLVESLVNDSKDIECINFAREFSIGINFHLDKLYQHSFSIYKSKWLESSIHKSEDFISVIVSSEKPMIFGRFSGITDDGQLLLDSEHGIKAITSGHLEKW